MDKRASVHSKREGINSTLSTIKRASKQTWQTLMVSQELCLQI